VPGPFFVLRLGERPAPQEGQAVELGLLRAEQRGPIEELDLLERFRPLGLLQLPELEPPPDVLESLQNSRPQLLNELLNPLALACGFDLLPDDP